MRINNDVAHRGLHVYILKFHGINVHSYTYSDDDDGADAETEWWLTTRVSLLAFLWVEYTHLSG